LAMLRLGVFATAEPHLWWGPIEMNRPWSWLGLARGRRSRVAPPIIRRFRAK